LYDIVITLIFMGKRDEAVYVDKIRHDDQHF
jgi:hypothetical protein